MKMKIVIGLFFFFFHLGAQGVSHSDGILFQNPERNTTEIDLMTQTLMQKTSDLLPLGIRTLIKKPINIRWMNLGDQDAALPECSPNTKDAKGEIQKSINGFVYGRYMPLLREIWLNRKLLLYMTPPFLESSAHCQNARFRIVQGVLLHELAHFLDRQLRFPSDTQKYSLLGQFSSGLFGSKNKNRQAFGSPDPYEFASPSEHFAVNFEYFILDSNYSCRRPLMYNFFSELFHVKFRTTTNCQKINFVWTNSLPNKRIDLDPARIFEVHYLLAEKGSELASKYGHSMLRLVFCAPEHLSSRNGTIIPETPLGEECLKDTDYHIVVSFRAAPNTPLLTISNGLTGTYPSRMLLFGLNEIVNEYTRQEMRGLRSIPLKLSKVELERLTDRIVEVFWTYKGVYKFFSNNCATETFELVESILNTDRMSSSKPNKPYSVLENWIKTGLIDFQLNKNVNSKGSFESQLPNIQESYNQLFGSSNKDKERFINQIAKQYLDLNIKRRLEIIERSTGLLTWIQKESEPLSGYLRRTREEIAKNIEDEIKLFKLGSAWLYLEEFSSERYSIKSQQKVLNAVFAEGEQSQFKELWMDLVKIDVSVFLNASYEYGLPQNFEVDSNLLLGESHRPDDRSRNKLIEFGHAYSYFLRTNYLSDYQEELANEEVRRRIKWKLLTVGKHIARVKKLLSIRT